MAVFYKPNYKEKSWTVSGTVKWTAGHVGGTNPEEMQADQAGAVRIALPWNGNYISIGLMFGDVLAPDGNGNYVDGLADTCNLPGCTKNHVGTVNTDPNIPATWIGVPVEVCPDGLDNCPWPAMDCSSHSSHIHTYGAHWYFSVGTPGGSYSGVVPAPYSIDIGAELPYSLGCLDANDNPLPPLVGRIYSNLSHSITYTVTVRNWYDLQGSTAAWYLDDNNFEKQILWYRTVDRSLSGMEDTGMVFDELARGPIIVEGTIGGHNFSVITNMAAPTSITKEIVQIRQSAGCGYPGGYVVTQQVNGQTVSSPNPMVTTTFQRQTGAPSWDGHIYEGRRREQYRDVYGYGKLVLDGDTMSLYTKGDTGYAGDGPIVYMEDHTGSFEIDYDPYVQYQDSTPGPVYDYEATVEKIPSFTPATYDTNGNLTSIGSWQWNTPHTWTGAGHTKRWRGWWTLYGTIITGKNVDGSLQDYFTTPWGESGPECEFIDLPQTPYPPPGETNYPFIKFGGVKITNLGNDEPHFEAPWDTHFGDHRVMGKAHSDFQLSVPALKIHLAPEGLQATPLFEFFNAGGDWTGTNCTPTVEADGLKVELTGAAPHSITRDCSGLDKWLHGTRFARVHWWSDGAAEIKVTVSGYTWILKATAGGEHTTEIDLCRPDCTLGTGGTGTAGNLKWNPATGHLLWNPQTGHLVNDCGGGTVPGVCDPADQAQSLIPVVLPKNIDLPTPIERPHGATWPRGWGVGRIGDVTVEFVTEGVIYRLRDIHLYRKTSAEGGFAKIFVMPQSAFPHTNDGDTLTANMSTGTSGAVSGAGDIAIYYAGKQVLAGDPHDTHYDCFQIPVAWIVIDGAVVLEGSMGGPEWVNGPAVLEPSWDWNYLECDQLTGGNTMPPFYPWDNYDAPTRQVTNGIVRVEALPRPEGFPQWYMCHLDRVNDTITDGMELTLSIKADVFSCPHFAGAPMAAMDRKTMGGMLYGLAYNGERPVVEGDVTVNAPNGLQTVQTDALGYWSTDRVQSVVVTGGVMGDASILVDGEVTTKARNRWRTRIVVDKS